MRAVAEPRRARPEGQSFAAFRYTAAAFRFWWHHHPELELTWIESGAGTRFVGDHIAPFGPGDLVLLGGHLPHTWSSEGRAAGARSHRAIVVHLPVELFDLAAPEFAGVRALLQRAHRGLAFSSRASAAVAEALVRLPAQRGLTAWSALAGILQRLGADRAATPLASEGYVPVDWQGVQPRLARALAYIEDHLADDTLTLGDVARTVHLSAAAFSRFFRAHTGGTLVQHITARRIARACRRLSETDERVAEIAYACGFGTLANFNRRFRALKKMTPSAFRARFRGEARARPSARRVRA
ncbi:MAG: AraC family transcriptional regulator [Gemmatimonadetes bacterium]|nr:AraC family transcriptional regulator [Gemmatimonadota bacterium]